MRAPCASDAGTGTATLGPSSSRRRLSRGRRPSAEASCSRAARCARSTLAAACAPSADRSTTCGAPAAAASAGRSSCFLVRLIAWLCSSFRSTTCGAPAAAASAGRRRQPRARLSLFISSPGSARLAGPPPAAPPRPPRQQGAGVSRELVFPCSSHRLALLIFPVRHLQRPRGRRVSRAQAPAAGSSFLFPFISCLARLSGPRPAAAPGPLRQQKCRSQQRAPLLHPPFLASPLPLSRQPATLSPRAGSRGRAAAPRSPPCRAPPPASACARPGAPPFTARACSVRKKSATRSIAGGR